MKFQNWTLKIEIWKLKIDNWKLKFNIVNCWSMFTSSLYLLHYLAGLKKSSIVWFLAIFDSQWLVFGLGLFQNTFFNLLINNNNFFWIYCFILLRWNKGCRPVRKSDFNENPVISLDLDFRLRLRVCQKLDTCLHYRCCYNYTFWNQLKNFKMITSI